MERSQVDVCDFFFFFQAEDGIRDSSVTGVQTCALPICSPGSEGITSEGSFALFSIAIRASGGKLILTPLKNFGFDLGAIARAGTPQTRIVEIANPDNPTGTAFGAAGFGGVMRKVPGAVVIFFD